MKVAIVANKLAKTQVIKQTLLQKLRDNGIGVDDQYPDIVISIGGDGTLLSAFHDYQDQVDRIRFIGVHTGHLGFYTDWQANELDDLVVSLLSDNDQAVTYPLLEVKVQFADTAKCREYLALNESALKKLSATLVTDVYIGGDFFERFRGDGLCVSTPTGSTAYNKSLGGAVVHPDLDVMQVAEISSLNNLVFRTLGSPMIISPNDTVKFIPEQETDFLLTVDAMTLPQKKIAQISYRVSKHRIRFAKYRHNDFWDRVQESFIGSKR